jgi:hypothetical protein
MAKRKKFYNIEIVLVAEETQRPLRGKLGTVINAVKLFFLGIIRDWVT